HAHYENCIQILSLLSQSEDQLRANHVSVAGRLRIAAPQGLLSMKGRSVLAPFLDRFPNVELEVDVSNELTDLVDARIDVAIRITVPEDSSLIARKLAPVPMVLVASRTYVDVRGLPPRPESLSGHACLSDRDSRADQQWPFRIDERRFVVSVSGPVRTNDPFIVRDLAREGHGIAMLPRVLADADLTAGRLEEILPGTLDATRNVYAITSQRRHLPKRAHVFIEHLRETLPATLVNKPARE
ncbi:MAG: hypothetical protein GY946_05925, partial [bacterium]|nr:hypothetical protein [bacterium]